MSSIDWFDFQRALDRIHELEARLRRIEHEMTQLQEPDQLSSTSERKAHHPD